LEDSGLKKNEIDEIVLVGGSTRIPKIRSLVKDFFNGKDPNTGINPGKKNKKKKKYLSVNNKNNYNLKIY
jgi:molecular chaperone DnaK (HSP70)